ncbi:hypothetical protein [Desulfosporosinus fructosivorans]
MREIVRYRRSIIEERTREVNRLKKVLEGGDIKLSSLASNVLGVFGQNRLEAMIRESETLRFWRILLKRS